MLKGRHFDDTDDIRSNTTAALKHRAAAPSTTQQDCYMCVCEIPYYFGVEEEIQQCLIFHEMVAYLIT